MKQVITIQLIITLAISLTLWVVIGKNIGRSYFWSGFSIVLPNLLLVIFSLSMKGRQTIFWLGAFVNKFISALLLVSSVKYLKDPNWIAFLMGIVITVYLPLAISGFGSRYLKHDTSA